MPSWNNDETSGESWIGDVSTLFADVGFISDFVVFSKCHLADVVDGGGLQAGETIKDTSCKGLADGNAPRCCIHGRVSEKVAAFKGKNTARRFFACFQHNVSLLI
jgi:hypothetical protein